MAFLKQLTLPNGYTAGYIRLESFHWDRGTREAVAQFAIYKDSAAASSGFSATPSLIRLRIFGQAFAQHFSPAGLAASPVDIVSKLYAASKQASGLSVEAARLAGLQIVSDFGTDVLAAATDA